MFTQVQWRHPRARDMVMNSSPPGGENLNNRCLLVPFKLVHPFLKNPWSQWTSQYHVVKKWRRVRDERFYSLCLSHLLPLPINIVQAKASGNRTPHAPNLEEIRFLGTIILGKHNIPIRYYLFPPPRTWRLQILCHTYHSEYTWLDIGTRCRWVWLVIAVDRACHFPI